jgi:hypothetical protein
MARREGFRVSIMFDVSSPKSSWLEFGDLFLPHSFQ